MINVVIADDSPTCLSFLLELLEHDSEVNVVGQAADGIEAVQLTKKLRPHVVVMDLYMPGLDGIEATRQIMQSVPTPIVIVSSSARVTDCELSMNALKAGALAILCKPKFNSYAPTFETTANDFSRTVKSMADVKVVRQYAVCGARKKVNLPDRAASVQRTGHAFKPEVLAIVASTGGPPALATLLSSLPANFNLPILIVQHITAGFINGLAEWLGRSTSLTIKVAEQGELLQPGTVYLAPDCFHLGINNRRISLSEDPKIGGFRPSGTYLFSSVAEAFSGKMLAVVLTGMGSDGVHSLPKLRSLGGMVIAQDECTSVVFGMPGAAIEAKCADMILPLPEIANQIMELCENA